MTLAVTGHDSIVVREVFNLWQKAKLIEMYIFGPLIFALLPSAFMLGLFAQREGIVLGGISVTGTIMIFILCLWLDCLRRNNDHRSLNIYQEIFSALCIIAGISLLAILLGGLK